MRGPERELDAGSRETGREHKWLWGPRGGGAREGSGWATVSFHQCLGSSRAGGLQSEGFLEVEAQGTELPPSPILCPCRASWPSGARGRVRSEQGLRGGGLPEAPRPAPNGRAEGDGCTRPAGGVNGKRGPGRSGSASGGAGQTVTRDGERECSRWRGGWAGTQTWATGGAAMHSGSTPPSGRARSPSGSRPHRPAPPRAAHPAVSSAVPLSGERPSQRGSPRPRALPLHGVRPPPPQRECIRPAQRPSPGQDRPQSSAPPS